MRVLVLLAILAAFASAGLRIVRVLDPPKPVDVGRTLTLPAGPVVVNVWASWCEACQYEAQTIADFARAHPEVPLLGVDTEPSSAAGARAAADWGWHHQNVWDSNGDLGRKLAPEGLPTTLFLDAQHHVVQRIVGSASMAELESGLRKAT